ncbi:MAG TPA: hypothetical protein QKA37_03440 [Candidatus Megaira endosymbiont of Stentor roeselii]|nr:hypothetical protein [Candidatus Megaera endosymbiont of Stentor roeselii]
MKLGRKIILLLLHPLLVLREALILSLLHYLHLRLAVPLQKATVPVAHYQEKKVL